MPAIVLDHVTKRYGRITAVDDLTATAASGRVTAFLGANGSGKTTTMRVLLGLSTPDMGVATIGGKRYADLDHPLQVVGSVLDQGFHPNRSARNHLRIVAAQASAPRTRVEAVLEQMGLTDAGHRRVGGFSLGMRQRLNLAAALIGQPQALVLDEPFNGLDPNGIQTLRNFLRAFADSGGTVLLSSHLISELEHTVDDAIIIDQGRLVASGPVAGLVAPSRATIVSSPEGRALGEALRAAGGTVHEADPGTLVVSRLTPEDIGRVARDARFVVTRMQAQDQGLEAAFGALVDAKDATS